MINLIKSHKFLTLLAVISISSLVYSFFIKNEVQPKIITTLPVNQSTNFLINGQIGVEYSTEVNSSDFIITSIPEHTWKVDQATNNSIVISPVNQLDRLTTYTLTITWKKKYLGEYILTTQDTQKDYDLIQKVKDEIKTNYPLADKIPFERPGFSVVYSKPLTLEITLKNQGASKDEIINSVRDWVKENGLDPNSHSYTFSN